MTMPVRAVGHHGHNFIGYFPSIKLQRQVGWESLLEQDYYYLIDILREVLRYEEQPLRIPYTVKGKPRHYTPDVLLIMRSGQRVLVEVKPQKFVDTPANQLKFVAARRWCAENNDQFKIMTERDIRWGVRLTNVKKLTQFARHTVSQAMRGRIHAALLSAYSGQTIDALAHAVSPSDPKDALVAIYHLAFHGEIVMGLDDRRISGATTVWLPFQPAVAKG